MIIIEPIPITGDALASSNVPEDDYPAYSTGTTYALNAYAISLSAHSVYRSLQNSNLNHPLPVAPAKSTEWWQYVGKTNRYKMFDEINNTQTENPDSIEVELEPVLIANGVYLGAVDADSVTVTVTDAVEGVVYTETQSLILSNSASSFYNWCFRRIKRKTYFVSVLLPMYANATITISINKPGGIAKCGMCVVGPLEDVGLSAMGLGTDIKDYSTTIFNFDGTSETTRRGYSKRMTVDVILSNDVIDFVQEMLAGYRQTNVVWIGETRFGLAILYGKYSSFKNIIEYVLESRMSLQIEGTV